MLTREQLEANLAPVRRLVGVRDVTIIAITKRQPVAVYELCRQVGIYHVGENRAQEVRDKATEKSLTGLKLHFIAPVQSKNLKYLTGKIYSFDALDNLDTARELNRRLATSDICLSVLLQLNCTGEGHKNGLDAGNYSAVLGFARQLAQFEKLQLQGVMAMGPTPRPGYDRGDILYERDLRQAFQLAAKTRQQLAEDLSHCLPRLSLGMSNDYDIALEFGSTELRLGSLLWQQNTEESSEKVGV